MNKVLPLLALLSLALVGCPKPDPKTDAAVKPADATEAAKAEPVDPAFVAYLEKVPADLKNDAFEYYGLGNGRTMTVEILRDGAPSQTGTRTVKPGEIKDGKATFVIRQEGGMESEGDITLSLESDGLYAMSSSVNHIKPHSLEMPPKLEVGGGWKDHTEMTQSSQKIVLDNDLKIVGKERVSTPGGTFDEALHVKSTGTGKFGSRPATLTTESWYVRGVGPVKQVLGIVYKDGQKQSVTVQLADSKKAAADSAATGSSAPPIDLLAPSGGSTP